MSNKNPSPATRFKAGEKPPGAGRPKEARDRLSRAFLTAFADSFEKEGADAIKRVCMEDPSTYVRVAASLQPKELEITDPLRSLTDEKLAEVIELLTANIRAKAPPKTPEEQTKRTVN
jgi:hypothetical protein